MNNASKSEHNIIINFFKKSFQKSIDIFIYFIYNEENKGRRKNMERKQRKAKVEFKDKTLLIDVTDYESSILPALVERIKKEYKTDEFLITDILY